MDALGRLGPTMRVCAVAVAARRLCGVRRDGDGGSTARSVDEGELPEAIASLVEPGRASDAEVRCDRPPASPALSLSRDAAVGKIRASAAVSLQQHGWRCWPYERMTSTRGLHNEHDEGPVGPEILRCWFAHEVNSSLRGSPEARRALKTTLGLPPFCVSCVCPASMRLLDVRVV